MKHMVAHTLRRLARVLIGVSRRLDPPKDETRLIGSTASLHAGMEAGFALAERLRKPSADQH